MGRGYNDMISKRGVRGRERSVKESIRVIKRERLLVGYAGLQNSILQYSDF